MSHAGTSPPSPPTPLALPAPRVAAGPAGQRATRLSQEPVVASRPYHLYPLLGIVLLVIAVLAISYRLKHPPDR